MKSVIIPPSLNHESEQPTPIMSQGGGDQNLYGNQSNHSKDLEPTPLEIERYHGDEHFQRMMHHFLQEEREAYFLQLAQQGARLPHDFNVENIITPEVKTPIIAMMKQMHAMQVKLN